VRLVVDANLSPVVADLLNEAGHDAVHVRSAGLQAANDDSIIEYARAEHRVIISEDTDFGAILVRSGGSLPSFILLRSAEPLTPARQAELLLANLATVEEDLSSGAIVTLARDRLRVRPLPVRQRDG
jgi:predicted nuclease of predicted toxin-antitoxin system